LQLAALAGAGVVVAEQLRQQQPLTHAPAAGGHHADADEALEQGAPPGMAAGLQQLPGTGRGQAAGAVTQVLADADQALPGQFHHRLPIES